MMSPTLFSPSQTVFACLSKACAPPPIGRGGSLRGPSVPSVPESETNRRVMQVSDRYTIQETDTRVNMKVQANKRIVERMVSSGDAARWVAQHGEERTSEMLAMIIARPHIDTFLSYMPEGVEMYRKLLDAARKKSGSGAEPAASEMDKFLKGEEDEDFNVYKTIKSLMQNASVSDVVKAFSGTDDVVKGLATLVSREVVNMWAKSASGSFLSDASFRSAAKLYDIPKAIESMAGNKGDFFRGTDVPTTESDVQLLDAYTRAEYRSTQDWFKEHGIETVHLYRGVVFPNKSPEVTGVDKGDTVNIQMNPLSSWAYDRYIAFGFTRAGSNHIGLNLSAVVPVSAVQSTAFTGRGCLSECEMIMIGYGGEALVVDRVDNTAS